MSSTEEIATGGTTLALGEHPVLHVRGICKTYTADPVLVDAELSAFRGEILGLLGSNGAGKSTLLKIVGGVVAPNAGEMSLDGAPVDFDGYGPLDAAAAGIFSVHQDLSVFSNLSVAENFGMAHGARGRVSRRQLRAAAAGALEAVFPGSSIPPRAETGLLTMGERQMVEIAIAATRPGLSILILDEPTSALSAERAAQLHDYLRRRKAEGVLVIYVTHKLDDVLEVADRLVVLRDGRIHWEGDPRTVTRDRLLVHLGARARPSDEEAEPRPEAPPVGEPASAAPLLTTRRQHPSVARGIELRVAPGEVVGVAGLEGAGQPGLLREVYASSRRRRGGAFEVPGGAAYVSGDRKREGIFALWDIAENLVISSLAALSRLGFVDRRAAAATVDRWYGDLGIVAAGPTAPITSLSGGNQQKVIIARGFASGASVVLLDDPTRGVDIETKDQFYALLRTLRAEGRSAVLYSTEDREFSQCDRVYVMARGEIVRELRGAENTRENIIHWSYSGRGGVTDAATRPAGAQRQRAGRRPAPRLSVRGALDAARTSRLSLVVVLLVAVLVAMGVNQPKSLTGVGLGLLLEPAMTLVLIALAQTFIMAAGDFDVGIGYAVGLANVITATVLVDTPWLGGLLMAAMVGGYALMAVVAEVTGVPAIVITLGSSFIWLGSGLMLQDVPGGSSPAWLEPLTVLLRPVPLQIYLCAGLAVAAWFILRRWRYGVALRAYGNNRQAFAETGRSTLGARVTYYAMAGVCVVAAGTFTTASTTGSDINASATLTLASAAAAVIGGAEFTGGVVEPVGTVLAAIAFAFIPSLLIFLDIAPFWQTAVLGTLLVAAMVVRRIARGTSR